MNIALYGGSFNPPHISHIFSATYVSMIGDFDKAIVYPCFSNPTGKKLIDFKHRVAMCHLAMSHLPNVIISEIESTLSEPSFTINTVKAFKNMYPDAQFKLIVGSDIIKNQHLWKKEHLEEIKEIAPFFILNRAGFEDNSKHSVTMPSVSSTDIRNMILSNNINDLNKVLPTNIIKYIKDHNLYV